MMGFLYKIYEPFLEKAIQIKYKVVGITIILFLVTIFVFSKMGGEFIPSLEEGDFAVETRVLPGSNLTTTIESTQKAAHILKSRFPSFPK